jgi:SAM-dependent methyltransferase
LLHAYGVHLHRLASLRGARNLGASNRPVTTFFFRNRSLLELLSRLLDQKHHGADVGIAVIGCSKGAEVYSISHAIRRVRPDLKVRICASDLSRDVLEFAEAGLYALNNGDAWGIKDLNSPADDVVHKTFRDQPSSMFERMSALEMAELFDREGNRVKVKPTYRQGITWHVADARDPDLVAALGIHDLVIANNFLCHMPQDEADRCLRNVARLVKPGGYICVCGVDLDLRSKVSRELCWKPVPDLIEEIHEGDPSARGGWPLQYWGLEPLNRRREDWRIRYAAVFLLPESDLTDWNCSAPGGDRQ